MLCVCASSIKPRTTAASMFRPGDVLPSAGRLLHRAGTRLVMSILKVVEQQPVDVELVQLANPLSRSRALLLVVVSEVAVSRKSLPVRGNVERGLAPGERFSRRPAELGRHQKAMKIRLRNGAGELQTSRGLSSQLDHAAGSHLLSEVGHLCRDALSSRGCAFQLDLEPYWFARPISGLFGIRILSISQSGLTKRSDLESRKPGQVESIALRDAQEQRTSMGSSLPDVFLLRYHQIDVDQGLALPSRADSAFLWV